MQQPCWNVRCGYGSFLTFEWGEPYLEIHEPRPEAKSKRLPRRGIFIHGDWHLWLYLCDWWAFEDGKEVASSHTKLTVQPAIQLLDGQKLTGVKVNHPAGQCIFFFDLNTELHTRPYVWTDRNADLDDQWMLFQPDEMILTLRGDGAYSHQTGDTLPEDELFIPREEWGGVPGWGSLPPGVTPEEGAQPIARQPIDAD